MDLSEEEVSLKIFVNIDWRATVTGFRRLGEGLLAPRAGAWVDESQIYPRDYAIL